VTTPAGRPPLFDPAAAARSSSLTDQGATVTDPTAEPDNPAAYALARHIADHPLGTVQAAFRYLNAGLALELREDPTAPAGVAPATDQAALRELVVEALYDARRPGLGGLTEAEAVARMADAVLAVLPAPVDRAAVLREAADRYATLIDQNEAYELAEHGAIDHESRLQHEAVRDVVIGLRRMADETRQPEAREWCKCPSCWGWFVEDHPGEDLDELGKDLGWWSGLPEHRDAPAAAQQPEEADGLAALRNACPATHGALGRICELPKGHAGMHTGSGPNGGAVWEGDAS
jgi:hypothetical protein